MRLSSFIQVMDNNESSRNAFNQSPSDPSRQPMLAVPDPVPTRQADVTIARTSDAPNTGQLVDRDSGIHADNELTVPTLLDYGKPADINPIEDVVQHHIRRSSIISRISETPSFAVNPKDELCGWGPFSPTFCQEFRKPKWVLVWLSLAGVCQVGSLIL